MAITVVLRVDGDTVYVDTKQIQGWKSGHFGLFSRTYDLTKDPSGDVPELAKGDTVEVEVNRGSFMITRARKLGVTPKISDQIGNEHNSSGRVMLRVVSVVDGNVHFVGEGGRQGYFPVRYLRDDKMLGYLTRHTKISALFTATEHEEPYEPRIESIY